MELAYRNKREECMQRLSYSDIRTDILKSRSNDNNCNKRKNYASHSRLFRSLVVLVISFVALTNVLTVVHAKPRLAASKAIIRTTTKGIPSLHHKTSSVGPKSTSNSNHHEEELMSGTTAIANVLADLCPHGMLPIGMLLVFETLLCNKYVVFRLLTGGILPDL